MGSLVEEAMTPDMLIETVSWLLGVRGQGAQSKSSVRGETPHKSGTL